MDKWNITFRRKGGNWSPPAIYTSVPAAVKRMQFDSKGYKVSGEYDIEIRRGPTRRGKLIRQYRA